MLKNKKTPTYIALLLMFGFVTLQRQHTNSPNTQYKNKQFNPTISNEITDKNTGPVKDDNGNITTTSLAHLTLEKKPFLVDDYPQNNIIISFFSSTCPYCTQQTQVFESNRNKLDYEVFYVPFYEEYNKASDHLKSLDLGVDQDRILEDPDFLFAKTFNLKATPTNLFANQKNPIVKGIVGLTSGEIHGKNNEEFLSYLFDLLNE